MSSRVLALALVLSSGCSVLLKGVPDDWTPQTQPDCQPFLLVPVLDGVVGASLAGYAIGNQCRELGVGCAVTAGASAAVLSAAIYGYIKVKNCKKAQAEFRSMTRQESVDSRSRRPHSPAPWVAEIPDVQRK